MTLLPKPTTQSGSKQIGEAIKRVRDKDKRMLPQQAPVGGFGGGGSQGSDGGSLPATELTLKEIDGAPDVTPVTTIRVPNGSLTDDGSGQVTLAYAIINGLWQRSGTVLTPLNAGDTVEIAQTSLTGSALKVSRNLATADTNSPVVEIVQHNAGDDQPALSVRQDTGGTSAIEVVSITRAFKGTVTVAIGVGADLTAEGIGGIAVLGTCSAGTGASKGIQGIVSSSDNVAYGGHFDQTKVGLYADFDEGSAPAAAPANDVRVYALTGGLMYARDDGAVGIHKLSNILTLQTITADYDVLTDDDVILCNPSGGTFTITLYAASGNTGRKLVVKNTDTSNDVSVAGNAFETIDGVGIVLVSPKGSLTIVCDGSNWHVIAN